MQIFLTIKKDGMKTNVKKLIDLKNLLKNLLTKECVIKDLFGILVIVSVNVINHVTKENFGTIKAVNVEIKWFINYLKSVVMKIFIKIKMIQNEALDEVLLYTVPVNDYEKNVLFLYTIHFTICCICSNNHSH